MTMSEIEDPLEPKSHTFDDAIIDDIILWIHYCLIGTPIRQSVKRRLEKTTKLSEHEINTLLDSLDQYIDGNSITIGGIIPKKQLLKRVRLDEWISMTHPAFRTIYPCDFLDYMSRTYSGSFTTRAIRNRYHDLEADGKVSKYSRVIKRFLQDYSTKMNTGVERTTVLKKS